MPDYDGNPTDEDECERCGISGADEELNDCGYCGAFLVCQGCEGICCDEDGDNA
jgi:hypothetical protein